MNKFNELVEKYMECDKRTLAELLAIKDLEHIKREPLECPPYHPYVYPLYCPNHPYRWEISDYPYPPITWCSTNTYDRDKVN